MRLVRGIIGGCVLLSSASGVVLAVEATYHYDDAGRLTSILYDDGTAITYQLDEAGNRISQSAVAVVRYGITGTTVTEGSPITFTVTRSGRLVAPTSVSYQSRNSVATAPYATSPADFVSASGTLNFAAGETQKTFTVATVNDSIPEPSEWVAIDLLNPSPGTENELSPGMGTILDNDPVPSCSFAAMNAEGNDEFTVYAYLQRTGSCSTAVTVSYSVQYISGTGYYSAGTLLGGATINPGDQYKHLPLSPLFGSVQPGSPLRLKVTWTITSGSGVITPFESYVTFYNSDCYC